MKEKVLITGASGFIGFHLVEAALRKGLEVCVAVRRTSSTSHLAAYDIQYAYPDFSSALALGRQLREISCQYIIHAAGTTKAGSEAEYNEVNGGYTYNLASAAGREVKKFVYLSSLAAVGPLNEPAGVITEDTPPRPVTAYGRSKLLGEQRIAGMPLPSVVIRPTAVYGPREKDIFMLFRSVNKGWEPYIGRSRQRLSFVYAKDLAAVAVSALFSDRPPGAIYNISDGDAYGRYDLAETARAILQKKTIRVHLPYGLVKALAWVAESAGGLVNRTPVLNREKLNELTAANWFCSIDRAKAELGYRPAYNLQRGLQETLRWYKQHRWL